LRAGLSVRAAISHGTGDQAWAEKTAKEMKNLETRYNLSQQPTQKTEAGDHP
jgi:hypothetical protein